MKRFIKEVFSSENFKKAMIYALFTQPNLTKHDYQNLTNILRNMDAKDINKEVQVKKAA